MDASEDLTRILADWHERRDQGESVEPDEVIAAHPEYAEELRDRFAVIDLMESRFPRRGPVPQRIGEFHIVREIGRGGMGVVYEANQPSMRRKVALKVLLPSVVASPRAVKRFQREAQATGALKHTNIVQVHQLGEEGGIWFTALELVDGRPLSDVLDGIRRLRRSRDGTHTPGKESEVLTGTTTGSRAYYQRVAAMFGDVADALDVAHEHGVVHRDIKPSNLLLDAEGNLKIVDFGLARLDDAASMTMTGDVVGTPNYMSPEQIVGARDTVDHRTDVYSLGATLYEVFALKPPFTASTLPALVRRILKEEPRSLRRHDRKIPLDLDTIVLKALEKEPRKRFASAGAMAEELRAYAQGRAIQTRRTTVVEKVWRKARRHKVRTALVATIAVLAIAATLFGLAHDRQSRRREQLEYDSLIERAQKRMGISSPTAGAEALALLEQAAAMRPEAAEAYFHRSLLEYRGLAACLEDLEEAEGRGLPPRTAALARAGLLWNAARVPEARAELDRAAALPSAGPADDWLEAVVLSRQGRWSEALERLDRALRDAPPGSTPHRSALWWRATARGAIRDHVGQLEDVSALRQSGMDSVSLRMHAAALWRRIGREAEARRAFDQLLTSVRESGEESAWLELIEADRGDWQLEATAEAVAAHADSVTLWTSRSHALRRAHRIPEAVDAAQRATDLDAENVPALIALAYAEAEAQHHWKAYKDARRALELGPEVRAAQQCLAHVQVRRGRTRQALAQIRQAMQEDPYDPRWVLMEAEALHQGHRYEEALVASRRWTLLQPANPRCRLSEGAYLRELDRADEAGAVLNDLLAWEGLAPDDLAHIAYQLGLLGRDEDATEILDGLFARNEGTPVAYVARASILRRQGELDEAIANVRRGLAAHERHPTLRAVLLELAAEQGGEETVHQTLDAWIAGDPRDVKLRRAKARALLDAGKPVEALAEYEAALEIDPAHADVLVQYGACCQFLSRMEAAQAASARALAEHPEDPYLLASVGAERNNSGAFAEGAAYLERAVAQDPHEGRWWAHLAVSYRNLGRSADAYQAAQRGVKESPRSAETLHHLANIEMRRGRVEEALSLVDRALEMGEDLPFDLRATRALILSMLHRHEEAVVEAAALAQRWPGHRMARGRYAQVLQGAGRLEEAVREHQAALRLVAKHPFLRGKALTSYAEALKLLGRLPEAQSALEEALDLGLGEDFDTLGQLSNVCLRLGQADRAIELLERALAIQPEPYNNVHKLLLQALLAAGKSEEAVERAREQIVRFPDEVDAKAVLGDVLLGAGRVEDAIGVLEEALAASPSSAWLLGSLGSALLKGGKLDRYAEIESARLAALRQEVAEGPSNVARHRALLLGLDIAIQLAGRAGRREVARSYIAELEAASRAAHGRWPRVNEFIHGCTMAAWYRVGLAEAEADWSGVREHGLEALRWSQKQDPAQANVALLRGQQLGLHRACGTAAWHLEDLDALRQHARDSMDIARGFSEREPDTPGRRAIRCGFATWASILASMTGHPEEALAILDEEIPWEGDLEVRIRVCRAAALAACGRAPEAHDLLEQVSPEAFHGTNEFAAGLGAGLHLRDPAILRRVLEANRDYAPQGTDRYLLLAWRFLEETDEVKRVLALLDAYVDAAPAVAPAAARAAWFAAVAGRPERARELLKGLGPDDLPHAAMFAARAYAVLGEEAEALRYLAHARKKGEEFAERPLDPALAAIAPDSE